MDKAALNDEMRAAVFSDRRWLLDLIADDHARRVICTPAPNDSYELFQATVREELEVLWDLDINRSHYGLSDIQGRTVTECVRSLEEYEENFDAWKKLSEETMSGTEPPKVAPPLMRRTPTTKQDKTTTQ